MIRAIFAYIWNKITYIPEWSLRAELQNYAITSCYNRAVPIYETRIYRMDKGRNPIMGYRIRRVSIDENHAKLTHYNSVKDAIKLEMGTVRAEEFFWEKE